MSFFFFSFFFLFFFFLGRDTYICSFTVSFFFVDEMDALKAELNKMAEASKVTISLKVLNSDFG